MSAPTAAQQRYWNALVERGCIITGRPAEIAHCHGGSIVERMQEAKAKGKKLERYNWLVLPLAPELAREPYPFALDTDVAAWEARNGAQAAFIDVLAIEYGLDLWGLAMTRPVRRARRISKIVPRPMHV